MARSKKLVESVEINVVRETLRRMIIEKYGSIPKFLRTEEGESLGGMKIRPCLYEKGAISTSVLSSLCEFFGLGKLTRKVRIVRTVEYFISPIAKE